MIDIISRGAVQDEAWDSLVDASDEGWVFGLSGWQRVILAVTEWGVVDLSVAVTDSDKLVAVLPLQSQPKARRVGSSGFGGTGPILAAGLSDGMRRRILKPLFEYVFDVCRELGATRFDMGLSPVTRAALNNTRGVAPYLEFGLRDISTVSKVASLECAESELWDSLSKNARQMIRRARSLGYKVERSSWNGMVDDYYRVHVETYHRTGVIPHPKAYFEGIAAEIGSRGNSVLWVGRNTDGRAVAFHNDARMANVSMYHTGCCETEELKSGINFLLFWEAIRGARLEDCLWYEIGEVFLYPQTEKERGLSVFKSKFGGELHRSFKWVVEWPDLSQLSVVTATNNKPSVTGSVNKSGHESVRGRYGVSSITSMLDNLMRRYLNRIRKNLL